MRLDFLTLGKPVAEIISESANPLLSAHPSWKRIALGLVAEILNGYAFESQKFSKKIGFPLLRIRDVGKNATACLYTGDYDSTYVVKKGDLLIGMDGDFNSAVWNGPDALLNQRVCRVVVETEHYIKNFLEMLLPAYLKEINKNTSSVTVKHLSSKSVAEIPLPLPPLNEQHRIVGKVEELFSFLDAGVASLRKVQAQLKRYRQAVLKYAFEGKLTEEWRKTQKEPTDSSIPYLETNQQPNESSDLRPLPAGWKWIRIQNIARITGGLTKNPQRAKYSLKMPYLRVANVYAGKLLLTEIKHVGVSEEEVDKLRLNKGDLLIVEGNGSVEQIGRAAIWEGQISPCVHQNHIIKIRLAEIADSKYVLYWLLSLDGRGHIKRVASSTSGLYTLSISKVSALPIPYASQVERHEIVKAIEQNLSVLEHVEGYLPTLFLLADRLRQSILKRAFEGRLVPQNPNDEPADKLLERIGEEREKSRGEKYANRGKEMKPKQLELSTYVK
jgi:type I restriction enzyme S subunit